MEELGLELVSLVCCDGLFLTEAGYPTREQNARHCLCGDVWKREGFWPMGEVVHCCEVVLKFYRGRWWTDKVNMNVEEVGSRNGEGGKENDCVARNLGALRV